MDWPGCKGLFAGVGSTTTTAVGEPCVGADEAAPIPNTFASILLFNPQHLTSAPAISAQLCAPAAMAVTPLPRPITSTGVLLSVVVPLPSWPLLFNPQHFTTPPAVSAQVWNSPAEMAV